MVEIIFKDKNLIAVKKPAGMPTQPDPTGDVDLMTATAEMLLEKGERNSLWLVHRLDRVVGGVVVFARSKAAAARLSQIVAEHEANKEYLAVVHGECRGGLYEDYLFKDTKKSKSFVVDRERQGVKLARLECHPVSSVTTERGVYTLVKVRLFTGRFHQIRVQLSHRSNSIVGDGKYGSRDNRAKMPALFSSGLAFTMDGVEYVLRSAPDKSEYPWSLFCDLL